MPKAKKKKTVHHRKRVGAMGKHSDAIQLGAGAAIGAGAGWYIYTTQKTIQDNLMGLLQAGLGAGLLIFTKNPLLHGVGLGMIGSAAIIEGESFGLLSGVTNLPNQNRLSGYDAVRQLGAAPVSRFPSPSAVGSANMARKYAGTYRR